MMSIPVIVQSVGEDNILHTIGYSIIFVYSSCRCSVSMKKNLDQETTNFLLEWWTLLLLMLKHLMVGF
jgi:hypothetical protein